MADLRLERSNHETFPFLSPLSTTQVMRRGGCEHVCTLERQPLSLLPHSDCDYPIAACRPKCCC